MTTPFSPQHVREEGWGSQFGAAQVSGSNADVSFTITNPGSPSPLTNLPISVGCYGVCWSYTGGTPTTGRITVLDGTTAVIDLDLPGTATYGVINFGAPFWGAPGNNVVIKLYAGGTGITGKVAPLAPVVGYTPATVQSGGSGDLPIIL